MDVVATQSSSSAPVEISWSPPSDAAPAIIGYRIFFGNGQNLVVPSYVTSIGLTLIGSSQVGSVSIRSESIQLPSALITATVTTAGNLATRNIIQRLIIPQTCVDSLELHRYR